MPSLPADCVEETFLRSNIPRDAQVWETYEIIEPDGPIHEQKKLYYRRVTWDAQTVMTKLFGRIHQRRVWRRRA